jgi:hypothetical protein
VSFGCANREELQQWRSHLEKLGIEHSGIKDASYGSGVSFRDPTTTPWIAFFVVTITAFFAILFTARYPRGPVRVQPRRDAVDLAGGLLHL